MRLRITAGELKGRYISAPDSQFTRPTTEKTRLAIFNLLLSRVNFEEEPVLDIYAGSGALGFEALSRGASMVTFVEKQFTVIQNLKENIRSLNSESKTTVIKTEAFKVTCNTPTFSYQLILADPPFFAFDIHGVVPNCLKNGWLKPEGLMVVERSIQTQNKDIIAFKKEPFRKMGDSLLYEFTPDDVSLFV